MTSTYTQPVTKNAGDPFTKDLYNIFVENDKFFRDPPNGYYALSTGASNLTTSSSPFVDLTNFSVTLTTQGNNLLILFMGRANGTTIRFDFLLDGVSITGDTDGVGAPGATGFVTIARIVAATPGSHTIKVQWRSTSGAVTFYAAGLGQLLVREL